MEVVGYVVCVVYLYMVMVQVDVLIGLNDYIKVFNFIWINLVMICMYIIGGFGVVEGMEGFGVFYEFFNLIVYNEICVVVVNVFFNYGMYLDSGDVKFFDIVEFLFFNNLLVGINLYGDCFFYVNFFEVDGVRCFNYGNGGCVKWFGCVCCFFNIFCLIL